MTDATAQVRPSASRAPASRAPRTGGLVDRFATEAVPAGVDYTQVLRTTTADPFTSMLGVTLALLGFMIGVPLAVMGLVAAFWAVAGAGAPWDEVYRSLIAYRHPYGLFAGHVGLALLIPLALGLVLFLHRVHPGFLSSVTGRLRPRWLLACLGLGFLSLWAVLLLQNVLAPGGPRFDLSPQDGAVWFLLVVLLTTPFQAAAEEYFFRGYLMQALGSIVRSPWLGIVASAAVFTLFHGSTNPALVADRFAFGLLAGWLVVRTGGLEAAIGAHVANNVSAFVIAALTSSVAEVRAITEVTWAAAAWDVGRFASFTLLAWLLARRFRPEQLTPRTPSTRPV